MKPSKKLFLFYLSFCLFSTAYAQIEVARLMTKTVSPNGSGTLVNQNFSANGFGAFLNLGFPLNTTGAITTEGGFYYFPKKDNRVIMVPVLAGYRYVLTGTDYGWYVEPKFGYTFGNTNIQKSNAIGNPLYRSNGQPLDQKVAGMTIGVGFGYLFQVIGRLRLNLGLRYEHTYVTGDPSPDILSLRISHALAFGRSEY
jgi:hypothetical protein